MEKLRKNVANELFDIFIEYIGVKENGRLKFIRVYTQDNPPNSYPLLGKVGPKSMFWCDPDGSSPRNSIISTWKTAKIKVRIDTANLKIDVVFNKELYRKQNKAKKETLINRIKDMVFNLAFNLTERWRK